MVWGRTKTGGVTWTRGRSGENRTFVLCYVLNEIPFENQNQCPCTPRQLPPLSPSSGVEEESRELPFFCFPLSSIFCPPPPSLSLSVSLSLLTNGSLKGLGGLWVIHMGSSSFGRGKSSYDCSFKILLIGDSGVGKSSLLLSFISDSVHDLSPTIGTPPFSTLLDLSLSLPLFVSSFFSICFLPYACCPIIEPSFTFRRLLHFCFCFILFVYVGVELNLKQKSVC